jgi:hypothetical protein
MAATELPPRSMTLTVLSKVSPEVLFGSRRWTSLLKNWVRLPRSYLIPSC